MTFEDLLKKTSKSRKSKRIKECPLCLAQGSLIEYGNPTPLDVYYQTMKQLFECSVCSVTFYITFTMTFTDFDDSMIVEVVKK